MDAAKLTAQAMLPVHTVLLASLAVPGNEHIKAQGLRVSMHTYMFDLLAHRRPVKLMLRPPKEIYDITHVSMQCTRM